jgi:hypothetical protein
MVSSSQNRPREVTRQCDVIETWTDQYGQTWEKKHCYTR